MSDKCNYLKDLSFDRFKQNCYSKSCLGNLEFNEESLKLNVFDSKVQKI